MKKAKLKSIGLRALNDIYIIEEDPIETIVENDSGLTPEVVDALKSEKLIIPDKFSSFAQKYPCTGTVIAKGDKTKYKICVGSKIGYARLGVQRYKFQGKTMCDVREKDIHYLIEV